MKRKIAVWVVIGLLISSICVASSFDFGEYDDEALVALYMQLRQEFVDRGIEKTAKLLEGTYIIGKDIPAGGYILHAVYGGGGFWVTVDIIDGETEKSKFQKLIFPADHEDAVVKGEGSWKVELEEGDVLKCTAPIDLTIYSGISFD